MRAAANRRIGDAVGPDIQPVGEARQDRQGQRVSDRTEQVGHRPTKGGLGDVRRCRTVGDRPGQARIDPHHRGERVKLRVVAGAGRCPDGIKIPACSTSQLHEACRVLEVGRGQADSPTRACRLTGRLDIPVTRINLTAVVTSKQAAYIGCAGNRACRVALPGRTAGTTVSDQTADELGPANRARRVA